MHALLAEGPHLLAKSRIGTQNHSSIVSPPLSSLLSPGSKHFSPACHALSSFNQPHRHICQMNMTVGHSKNLETLQQLQMRPNHSRG